LSAWADAGLGGIYKGLTATILKQGTNQGIRFLVFNEVKKVMVGDDPKAKLPWYNTMLAGALAGAASVIGNNPLDVVKSRMQGLDAKKYKNSLDCLIQIYRESGFYGYVRP
jgi:solute carrier family 25 (mitochondrial citrate transporter), member 1